MGRSSGAGHPLVFKCALCRHHPLDGVWYADKFKLTGRTRPCRRTTGGCRTGSRAYEYTCGCGHTGWSKHIDIERLAIARAKKDE